MTAVWHIIRRVWRLFVDDGLAAGLLLGWIAAVGILSRQMQLGTLSGPLLFGGIAVIACVGIGSRR